MIPGIGIILLALLCIPEQPQESAFMQPKSRFLRLFRYNPCFAMSLPERSREEVMSVIERYSRKLKEDGIINRWYGLDYAGSDKVYDGKIHEISLGYSVDKNLQYQDARKLFYAIVDELLDEINSNPLILEYFYHQPITYEDLHFALAFDYENKGHLKKGDVEQISIKFNKTFYCIAKVDGAMRKILIKKNDLGIGTLSFTGLETTRTIIKNLPEATSTDLE